MKVCAALAWFDEPVEFLDRCIRSLEGVVDELVAVDGGWEHFPGASPMSGPDQEEAIWAAARASGVPVRVRVPDRVWESQVEKRAAVMAMAADHCEWTLVIDGDEYVSRCDPDALRAALETAIENVGIVSHRNLDAEPAENPDPPRAGLTRRLYRAGTTVITVHSGYVRHGEYLHAVEPVDLRDTLIIEHDNWNRGHERNARSRAYRRARQATGVEIWA